MKAASGSHVPLPSGLLGQRKHIGCFGSSPVTEACSTWIRPWSNSETLVGALAGLGLPAGAPGVRCAAWPATPSGCRFCVPSPSGTAFGT